MGSDGVAVIGGGASPIRRTILRGSDVLTPTSPGALGQTAICAIDEDLDTGSATVTLRAQIQGKPYDQADVATLGDDVPRPSETDVWVGFSTIQGAGGYLTSAGAFVQTWTTHTSGTPNFWLSSTYATAE